MGQDSSCGVSSICREEYGKLKQLFASPCHLEAWQRYGEQEMEAKRVSTLHEESDGMPESDCGSLI